MAFLVLGGACGKSEIIGAGRDDLEARILIVDLDRSDLGLGDATSLANQRHQPARIGVALAPDVEPEPDHLAIVFAPWTGRARTAIGSGI